MPALRRTSILVAALLLALGSACSDDNGSASADSGPDVVTDADAGDAGDAADAVPDVQEDGDVEEDAPDATDTGDADGGGGFPIAQPGPITDLRIEGLDGPVEIKLGEYGIPSIRCQSDEDCAAALGYLHARDRFIQMDIRRRVVRGRLSEIVGAGDLVLNVDTASRTLFSTPDGQPIEEVLVANASEKSMALLEAYANGVNAWIDDLENGRNGASLQLEYGFPLIILGDHITRWTPEDSLATVAALVENLTNDASSDLAFGEVFAEIAADADYDASVFADYFRPRPFSSSTIIDDYTYPANQKAALGSPVLDPGRLQRAEPALRQARATLDRIHALLGVASDRGSNNWVIGPTLSASGDALLSNDPHLGLANPSVWYIAHMDAVTDGDGDYHAAGMTFAGLPWVILGQNEHIAWGATNTGLDLSDVYLEELTEDGTGVVYGETEVPFVEVDHDFPQALGGSETATSLFVPHHGPVLSMDETAGTAVSLRWTGNLMTTDVNMLTELMRATSVEEGRAAVRNVTSIGQNWVMVDTAGHFGWFPYNTVPLRPWASAEQPTFMPLDGTGGQEWDGFVAYDDLPQAYDRAAGYLATANNDMTGALLDGDPSNDGHPVLQSSAAIGFRHQRIVDLIEASDQHTLATMRQIVGDTYSIIGETAAPALLTVERAGLSAHAQALWDAIDGWDMTCPTGLTTADPESDAVSDADELAEARGCAAFHRVFSDAFLGWSGDERRAAGWPRSPSVDSFLRALVRTDELTNPDLFWDDVSTEDTTETEADVLAAAFESAAGRFEDQVGDDPTEWLWGRVHTLTLRADLFSSFDVPNYDEGPYATRGGLYTVNVANPGLGSSTLNHGSGASMRLQCEAPASGVSCTIELPGGDRHFRDDPNYLGLLEKWRTNEPIDLDFEFDAVDATVITATAPDAQ